MPKYHVHIFPIVGVLVKDIEAEGQEEACRKAERMVDLDRLFDTMDPINTNVGGIHYTDDIDGFLVDEDGDEEHERSVRYDSKYRPV